MLLETIVVICIITPISATATWFLRNDVKSKIKLLILLVGPVIDSWLTWYLMGWLNVGLFATWGCTLSAGIISCVLMQPIFSPRRLVIFRLSVEQIRRRPRQAALMMAGLLVASSIITSSLVIGDSLDTTLSKEVEAVYGDTDLLISQKDRRTGFSADLDINLTSMMGQTLVASGYADKWSHGIESTVTITSASEKSIPSLSWFAYPEWNGVAVNDIAAKELDIDTGDSIDLTWYYYSDSGELQSDNSSMIVDAIIPMAGKGSMSGTKSPAIFTSLSISQEAQNKMSMVNTIRVSLDDGLVASETVPEIKTSLNQLIGYEEAGFEITSDGDALSISYAQGLGRLSADFMSSWEENRSTIISDGNEMQILQIPLVQIQQTEKILSLSDDVVNEIFATDDGDWYISGGGVSFQKERSGNSHSWNVPNGGLINDVTLLNNSVLVAHSNGLTEVFSDQKVDTIHHKKGSEYMVAALFNQSLPELPLTIFSIDYVNDGEKDWIAVKHLTGNEVHYYDNGSWKEFPISGEWLHYNGQVLIGSPTTGWSTLSGQISNQSMDAVKGGLLVEQNNLFSFDGDEIFLSNVSSECNNRAYSYDGDTICTTTYGALVQSEKVTPRLPKTVDIGGFGELPQMLLATDSSLSPPSGDILVSSRLSLLNQSENVLLNGLVPWAYGDDLPLTLEIVGNMTQFNAPGIDELESIIIGFVNLTDGEILAASDEGERSILVLTNASEPELYAWLNSVSTTDSMELRINPAKETALEAAEDGAGALSAMFLVFGAFTIAAGILLVVTIVMMLAESRRVDEAIIRAIGLKKSDMRSLAVMEGVITSSVASTLGGLFGLVLAYFVSLGFSSVFASAGADGIQFSFSLNSMLVGISSGFIIAMFTLWFTALWTSNLNIVQALRGLSPTKAKGIPWWVLFLIIASVGGGLLSGLSILTVDSSSSLIFAMWHISASLLIIGLTPIFVYIIPKFKGWRLVNVGQNTIGWIGILLIIWALTPDSWVPVSEGVNPDEITFTVLGLIQVFAGVMLLTGFAPRIATWLISKSVFSKRLGPVAKVSLAHPFSAPARTAVIMGMFSLTVFSVIVLAGYTVQFEEHSAGYVEDASGDFEILLSSSRRVPLNLSDDVNQWNLQTTNPEDIDAVGFVNRAVVWVEHEEDRIGYILRGVDDGFIDHGALPLEDWDRALGQTEAEAWRAMKNNQNIVFIDSSFALVDPNSGESIAGITLSIGKSISLIDISNPGNNREVVVGGILSQSSQLFSQGIWMDGKIAEEQFGGVTTRIYVSHTSEVTSNEIESSLSDDLSKEGIYTSVIQDEILLILGLVFAILLIFQAYLSLGLIVGIAGIGVVTYRSVSERSTEIGMLRALGFRKSMVMYGMLTEISWVSLLGMLNGAVVAISFHVALHDSFWKDQGVALILPWIEVMLLLVGGWILVLLATWIPVKKATKITPSQAISTID